MVEFSPATWEARVRFPANALFSILNVFLSERIIYIYIGIQVSSANGYGSFAAANS